jgi:hypothetical protein
MGHRQRGAGVGTANYLTLLSLNGAVAKQHLSPHLDSRTKRSDDSREVKSIVAVQVPLEEMRCYAALPTFRSPRTFLARVRLCDAPLRPRSTNMFYFFGL